MLNSEILQNIDESVFETELNITTALVAEYEKLDMITENYDGDCSQFIIFQEGTVSDEMKKSGAKHNTFMKIITFIPRLIMALWKTIKNKMSKYKGISKDEAQTIVDKINGVPTKVKVGAAVAGTAAIGGAATTIIMKHKKKLRDIQDAAEKSKKAMPPLIGQNSNVEKDTEEQTPLNEQKEKIDKPLRQQQTVNQYYESELNEFKKHFNEKILKESINNWNVLKNYLNGEIHYINNEIKQLKPQLNGLAPNTSEYESIKEMHDYYDKIKNLTQITRNAIDIILDIIKTTLHIFINDENLNTYKKSEKKCIYAMELTADQKNYMYSLINDVNKFVTNDHVITNLKESDFNNNPVAKDYIAIINESIAVHTKIERFHKANDEFKSDFEKLFNTSQSLVKMIHDKMQDIGYTTDTKVEDDFKEFINMDYDSTNVVRIADTVQAQDVQDNTKIHNVTEITVSYQFIKPTYITQIISDIYYALLKNIKSYEASRIDMSDLKENVGRVYSNGLGFIIHLTKIKDSRTYVSHKFNDRTGEAKYLYDKDIDVVSKTSKKFTKKLSKIDMSKFDDPCVLKLPSVLQQIINAGNNYVKQYTGILDKIYKTYVENPKLDKNK